MSGHTPGPWQVCNGTDVFTPLGARNAAGVEAAHNDGWHIADCDMGETETDEGPATLSYSEKRANARLIAAAPALLEALVDLIPYVVTDVLEHCDGNKCREQWCAGCVGEEEAEANVADARAKIVAARAAIRQATEGEGNE